MIRAIVVIISGAAALVGGAFTMKDGFKSYKAAKAAGKKIDFND